jgi:hypothetical protein
MFIEDIYKEFVKKQGRLKRLKEPLEEILKDFIENQNDQSRMIRVGDIMFDQQVSGKV